MKEKDEKILIPVGLRERDFKMFPAEEFKKIGPKFGCNAGVCLTKNLKRDLEVETSILIRNEFNQNLMSTSSYRLSTYLVGYRVKRIYQMHWLTN